MEKELVTTENIKEDILHIYYPETLKSAILLVVFGPIFASLFSDADTLDRAILIPILIIISLILLILVVNTIFQICVIAAVKAEKFKIKKSTVIKKLDVRRGRYFPRPYTLVFPKNKKFLISMPFKHSTGYSYYKWSETYHFSGEQMYNRTDVYDLFFVVLVGKKIVMAYNTKFFDLEKDITYGI